jgi:hypothetical protein
MFASKNDGFWDVAQGAATEDCCAPSSKHQCVFLFLIITRLCACPAHHQTEPHGRRA